MKAIQYIKIRGYPVQTENAVFQGIGGNISNEVDGGEVEIAPPATPISEDKKVAEALWKAQNGVIEEESAYIRKVATLFQEKLAEIPKEEGIVDTILDTVMTWIEVKVIAPIIKWVVELFKSSSPYGKAAIFVGFVLGSLAVKHLKELYAAWQTKLFSLITENDALLALEQTRENYLLRNQVLIMHTEKIENILHHAALLETQAQAISPTNSLSDLTEAVQDLAYNDEIIDFGTAKLYLHGKAVERG